MARSLEAMPQAAEAFSGGELSDSAVGLLASARESFPEAFTRCEEPLLQAARTLPVAALRSVIEYWRQSQDLAEAERDEDERFEHRNLNVSPTLHGMVRVDGDLDPETGQSLMSALRAVMDADARAHPSPELRPRASGAPTRSARSAGRGWTRAIVRRSSASARTWW